MNGTCQVMNVPWPNAEVPVAVIDYSEVSTHSSRSIGERGYPDESPNSKQERSARRSVKMVPCVIFYLDDRKERKLIIA